MFGSGAIFLLVVGYAQAQDANCDFFLNVAAGRSYPISSPNYPYSYRPGVTCRWIAQCPNGYNCRLDCSEINLPQTQNCYMDRLLVSKTGDSQLGSSEYHCGYGTLTAVSVANRISVGLVTSRSSRGGRFTCTVTAQASSTCSCGYRNVQSLKESYIVGGEETRPNEYPMMAGIVYVGENTIKCGAVIIDNGYVLTAAHCVVGKNLGELAVVVGEHDVSTGADSPSLQVFRVASVIIHPQFNSDTYDNDIAIIQIYGSIVYSQTVGPVCLPFKFINDDFTGSKVTILGWGTTFPGGPTSNVLRKVDVNVVSQGSCSRSYPSLSNNQMCTFAQGKDACQDDSGGPLLYQDPSNGRLYSAGIVSFGRFCASSYPGVNTRVTSYLYWILNNAPANYCNI
ncbi:venom serine protease-like [Danaus plexippus]|uniref:venom serine protease-like n=1 Tax=Danaus plexippus TaxID=13037 RepID=UPI002AB2AB81|nr:venom serine protease-like [Danaus plexippus]